MTPNIISLRLVLLVLTSCFTTLRSEVLVTSPLSVKEALGGTASFTCTVAAMQDDFAFIDWYIQLASGYGYYWSLHYSVFQAMGFVLDTTGPVTSNLHVPANRETNGTDVQCVVTRSQGDVVRSNMSNLFVFDRPSPPTNLSLSAVEEGALRFAWVPAFVPAGVTTWYRVIVRDVVAEKVVLNSSVTGNASYQYRHDGSWDEPPCRTYTFSVMASNAAGDGDLSQSLATTIPKAPRFSTEPVLRVSFNPASIQYSIEPPHVCPDFPVKGYLLKIRNTIDGSTVNLGPYVPNSNSSTFQIETSLSSGLRIESIYNSTIEVFNAVGGSTISLLLYTTHVQSSTIFGNDHQLNVTCFFAEGTLAKGCVVYLENSGNVLQHKLPRVSKVSNSIIKTEFSVDCYNISVVDWEEDGSIQSLNIPTIINIFTSQAYCVTAMLQFNPGLATHSIQTDFYIITGAAFATIVGLLVLIAVMLAILIHYKRMSKKNVLNERKEGRFRSQLSTSSDTYLLTTQCTPPSTPVTSAEKVCLTSSNEQTCPFPSPNTVLLDSLDSTRSTNEFSSNSIQL